MTAYRIDYIVKPNAFGRIEAVGGSYPKAWRDTEDAVIGFIRRGEHAFYVEGGGRRAQVIVEWNHNRPYLKTHPDGTKLDNLLHLPNAA